MLTLAGWIIFGLGVLTFLLGFVILCMDYLPRNIVATIDNQKFAAETIESILKDIVEILKLLPQATVLPVVLMLIGAGMIAMPFLLPAGTIQPLPTPIPSVTPAPLPPPPGI